METIALSQATDNIVKDIVGENCQQLFTDFIENFTNSDGKQIYLAEAQKLLEGENSTLSVSYPDIDSWNHHLAVTITEEYYRVYPFLCGSINVVLSKRTRLSPKKEFFLSVDLVPTFVKIRQLRSGKMGSLVRITGQVVRTHPVHPELVRGTFMCFECQTLIRNVEQQFKYSQPTICRNPVCNNRTRFILDVDKSRFVDFQKVRIQETQAELPRGSIPRSLEVILRADLVELAQAGDRCEFSGTLIVIPDVGALALPGAKAETATRMAGNRAYEVEGVRGLKALGVRDLNYRLAFLASSVKARNRAGVEDCAEEIIREMYSDRDLYQNLCSSLFPSIHGNDEVKRGILLMLFGGVGKKTAEGISLRGDMNICVVGDPSTAKSQLLKHVEELSPRAIYTSGKSTTAAGLTAAVVRDEESGELVIEAGALMLADGGVCCIDEFDKIETHDQVAIHEAMEQQTISIAKAGVKATLNARTCILAAANPLGGHYDRTKSLKRNVNMSAPIMSRFDLFFVLVDEYNEITDYAIANKIVQLHALNLHLFNRKYSLQNIRRYIAFARQFNPKIPPEAQDYIVQQYKLLRQRDAVGGHTSWRVTVRQLESIIRLSEAMARMFLRDEVELRHIKEACRLISKSIIRVDHPDILFQDGPDELYMPETPMAPATPVNVPSPERSSIPSTTAGYRTISITYEDYKQITNALVTHIRRVDELAELSQEMSSGLKRSELIAWYLEEIIADIDSEEELVERKIMLQRLIDRLIQSDHILIQLSHSDMNDNGVVTADDPFIVVHPNYTIDT